MSQDINNKNNNNKPRISLEDQKKLINMLIQSQHKQQANKSKSQLAMKNIIIKSLQIIQRIVVHIDKFINFVIRPQNPASNVVVEEAKGPILFGTYVIIIFIVIGGIWSATAPLDSAAMAVGKVISSTNKKVIQHKEGGIIKQIYVKQGDHVKEGDKLIELDDTQAKAHSEIYLSKYRTHLANEARLIAELQQLDEIEFPEILLDNINTAEVQKIVSTQKSLFHAERDAHSNTIEQYKKKLNLLKLKKVHKTKVLN